MAIVLSEYLSLPSLRCGIVQNAEVLPMIHSLRKQARRLLIITLTGGFISSTIYASFAMRF